MSPLPARRVIRTYSRQKKRSLYEEPPAKRRRVETSPQCDVMSSEVENECADVIAAIPASTSLTPSREVSEIPSSSPKLSLETPRSTTPTPPTSPALQNSSPPIRQRRPVFSFLKRRQKPEVKPLSEKSHNVSSPPKQPPPKKKRLVQMQLDLVDDVTKTCKVCGMDYIPSHTDDAALHRKFHAMNVGGVDIPKVLAEKLRRNLVWDGGDRSFIAVVSRRDGLALRKKASEVLKIVNTELGAVPMPDQVLWSQTCPRTSSTKAQQSPKESAEPSVTGSDRFKIYLYVRGQKCVGACLTERIQEAFAVLKQDDASGSTGQLPADSDHNNESPSSSISVAETTDAAILGVSRIWTSNLYRKHGIARRLLDSARSDFLYGMTIDKAEIAFSQPTESGGQLAKKWFGRQAGWHVYMDSS